jgi:predicted DNA-binding transcriptional regulator AlpA
MTVKHFVSHPSNTSPQILREKQVVEMIGLSRVTIWRMECAGKFPQRVQLSERAVGWIAEEVNFWLESLPRVNGGASK